MDAINNLGVIFSDALAEVIATVTSVYLQIIPSEEDPGFEEITGFMSLNGNNNGMVFISADEKTMRSICSFMTGLRISDIVVKDVEDALCELVNMTAGSAKLRFNSAEEAYSLSPPFIFRGSNMTIIPKKRVNIISTTLGNGDISIKLKVVFY